MTPARETPYTDTDTAVDERTNERKSHAKSELLRSPLGRTQRPTEQKKARASPSCAHRESGGVGVGVLTRTTIKDKIKIYLRQSQRNISAATNPSPRPPSPSKKRRRRRTADIDGPIRSRWCDGLSRIRIDNKGSDEWEGPERREPRVRTHEAGWTKDTQKVKKTNGRPRRHFDAPDHDAIRSW